MTPLSGKTTFAFDWDGTVLDSMPTKLETFSGLLAETLRPLLSTGAPDLQDRIRLRYEALSGRPRREIVATIVQGLGLAADAVNTNAFSDELTRRNGQALASAAVFPDSLALLRALVAAGRPVYLSSSVPQAELDELVRARLPGDVVSRLRGVFGSTGTFAKGPAHIARIRQETGAPPREILFFGDDLADAELCRKAGVDCVLVDRRDRFDGVATGAHRVRDFHALARAATEVEPA